MKKSFYDWWYNQLVFLSLPGFWFGDGAHHPTVRLQFKYPDIYNFSNFSLW